MSEKLVKCPFNPLHILPQSSLQRHTIRCMANYPNYVACPFNALHRFENKDLLAKHMLVCDAREKAYMFQEINGPISIGSKTNIHIDNVRDFNLELENWDSQY